MLWCLPAISILVSRNTPLESSALWLSCFLEDAEALLEPLDEAVEELLDRGGGGPAAVELVMDLVGNAWPVVEEILTACSKLSPYFGSMEGRNGSLVEYDLVSEAAEM